MLYLSPMFPTHISNCLLSSLLGISLWPTHPFQILRHSKPSLFQRMAPLLTQLLGTKTDNLFLFLLFPSYLMYSTSVNPDNLPANHMSDLTSSHHCLCNSPSSIARNFSCFIVLYSCLLHKTARMIRWFLEIYQCLLTAK